MLPSLLSGMGCYTWSIQYLKEAPRNGGFSDVFKNSTERRSKEIILKWLKDHEDISAAQIQDWLNEHYHELYNERTVRAYVAKLRQAYNLPRKKAGREYSSVPELPPGMQLQADFGVFNAERQDAHRIRLYFVIFILAHSRYKYIVWQTRHFTSIDFVRSLESCFQALGGCPAQLVIDQDRLMVVNENYGDIIFTQEFERCKIRHSLDLYVCRKGDPESKGMVESGVKYVKYNFARGRTFVNLEQWSQDSEAWLQRTGNGKVHSETKKIPAEVFKSEQHFLRPVISMEPVGIPFLSGPTHIAHRFRSGRKKGSF